MSDQVSKIVTKILQMEIETHTGQWLQQEQFGCVNMQVNRHGQLVGTCLHFPSTEVGSFVHVAVYGPGGCV